MQHLITLLSYRYRHHPDLHSFPTRRSSDLCQHILGSEILLHGFFDKRATKAALLQLLAQTLWAVATVGEARGEIGMRIGRDRKSTRLNSSHTVTSYAVFCLKKKR